MKLITVLRIGYYLLCLPAGWVFADARAASIPAGVQLDARQEIVRQNMAEPASLDPHKVESDVEFAIINDFFEPLIAIGDDGVIEPRLAIRWEQSHPTRWVFHLRPHLRWSNGDPITAGDVAASWRRLADPATASPYASYLANMQVEHAADIADGRQPPSALGVRALDDLRVEIRLRQPMAYFLQMLAHQVLVPVNTARIAKAGEKWAQPATFVSSGPFTLQEWVVNEKLTGVRNRCYWDDGQTRIERVTYLPIVSETAALNRYLAGEIDIVKTLPETQFADLQKRYGGEMRITPLLGTYYYDINTRKPPFDDARVRLALNLGLDKDIIAERIMGQGQSPAFLFSPPDIGGHRLQEPYYARWTRQQRLDRARELLAQAGFSTQRPLQFKLLYNTSETHRRLAIAASSMWKKNLGVEAILAHQEWKSMLDKARTGDFAVVRSGWYADYNDPSTFLNNFRGGDSGNFAGYRSPAYDAALDSAARAASTAAAAPFYQQAENTLAEDAPGIPVFHHVGVRLVKPHVGGFHETRLGFIATKDLYIMSH
ncbi:ABC transporter substrate-binding protein [Martelella alba]|uniref:Oligopeptide ABC transporter substrate-binding protein OppA n=1 Tax=Martelella alba TaxID=2590451 RepID=A0ABY2SLF4_9HYPH|nr:ABC transporter substrate-binding protein [Martelella alba]TKI06557.1 oligopeptide ABC transporter substrate-binding protein OppA [Martelella alba]